VQAVDERVVLHRELVQREGQPQPGDPAEQGSVDDLQFGPGQALPEALVWPEPEGDVGPVPPIRVQRVRIRERRGIMVGGSREMITPSPSWILVPPISVPVSATRPVPMSAIEK